MNRTTVLRTGPVRNICAAWCMHGPVTYNTLCRHETDWVFEPYPTTVINWRAVWSPSFLTQVLSYELIDLVVAAEWRSAGEWSTRTLRLRGIAVLPLISQPIMFDTFMPSIDGLAQDCSNSGALAMELLESCTEPLIWVCIDGQCNHWFK